MMPEHEWAFGKRMNELAEPSAKIGTPLPMDCCPERDCVVIDKDAAEAFNAQ